MTVVTVGKTAPLRLLEQFSLEVTGKDLPSLANVAPSIPAGTRVNVTYLAGEDMQARTAVISELSTLGLLPVPHILRSPAGVGNRSGGVSGAAR